MTKGRSSTGNVPALHERIVAGTFEAIGNRLGKHLATPNLIDKVVGWLVAAQLTELVPFLAFIVQVVPEVLPVPEKWSGLMGAALGRAMNEIENRKDKLPTDAGEQKKLFRSIVEAELDKEKFGEEKAAKKAETGPTFTESVSMLDEESVTALNQIVAILTDEEREKVFASPRPISAAGLAGICRLADEKARKTLLMSLVAPSKEPSKWEKMAHDAFSAIGKLFGVDSSAPKPPAPQGMTLHERDCRADIRRMQLAPRKQKGFWDRLF